MTEAVIVLCKSDPSSMLKSFLFMFIMGRYLDYCMWDPFCTGATSVLEELLFVYKVHVLHMEAVYWESEWVSSSLIIGPLKTTELGALAKKKHVYKKWSQQGKRQGHSLLQHHASNVPQMIREPSHLTHTNSSHPSSPVTHCINPPHAPFNLPHSLSFLSPSTVKYYIDSQVYFISYQLLISPLPAFELIA